NSLRILRKDDDSRNAPQWLDWGESGESFNRRPHHSDGSVYAAADDQPDQYQRQPHYGARQRDRRAQGVRRVFVDAGRTVHRRKCNFDASRRRHRVRDLALRAAVHHRKRLVPLCRVPPEPSYFPRRVHPGSLLRVAVRGLSCVEDVTIASGTGFEGRDARRRTMIKHLCKLVWNRKRINFLVTLEIFFSFLVVFAVIVFAVYYTDNYRRPLGYNYDNVWNIGVERRAGSGEKDLPQQLEASRRLLAALREFSEIESAAGVWGAPYSNGNWTSG